MRRVWPLAVALVAALALAACGGSSSESGDAADTARADAQAVLAAAASNAASSGSSKLTFSVTTQVPGQEAPVSLTGEGEFDYETRRGRMTYDFGPLFQALGEQADVGPAEFILDGNVFYMKFPLFAEVVPGAKEWIKVDLEAIGQEQGIDLGQLSQVGQTDPATTLDQLRAAGSVEELGVEEIRGVRATHYSAVIDLEKTVELAPENVRDDVRQAVEQLEQQLGERELEVEVWIDENGLPVRYRYDVPLAVDESDTSTVVVIDFFDWGVDVEIEPPPASQVTDITELSAQLGDGSSS